MTLAQRHQRLIDDLLIIPDRQERLAVIVDQARRLQPFSTVERIDGHRVTGCQSAVWLIGELQADGTLALRVDADSPLVKGLVHLLCAAYSGATPAEIAATEPTFLDELGLLRDLSPTRRNGLTAVRNRIREIARTITVSDSPASPSPT
jgi:cysteine desulfuration protein SufE